MLPVCGVHVCRPHREAQRLSLGAFVISAFRFHSIWSIPFVLYQLVGYPIQRIFLYPPRLFPSHIAHRCPLQPLHRGILTHRCNESPKHLCLGKQDISFGNPARMSFGIAISPIERITRCRGPFSVRTDSARTIYEYRLSSSGMIL